MKRITKKQAELWVGAAKNALLESGFENHITLETYIGFEKSSETNTVWAAIYFDQSVHFTVFFRFKTAVLPFTGMSGKCNFHEAGDLAEALDSLKCHIKEINEIL